MDDVQTEIESGGYGDDPWKDYPALRALLKERKDWDSDFPSPFLITVEECQAKGRQCVEVSNMTLGPRMAETGEVFDAFHSVWKEENEPLIIKKQQLEESFWNSKVPNILNHTWERPLIKHVIMAYGVDIHTEVAYGYKKKNVKDQGKSKEERDGVPNLDRIIWEEANGELLAEEMDVARSSLTELLIKKRRKRERLKKGSLEHSGDGSVPYLSLAWAHTWLLHAARAILHSGSFTRNPLEDIQVSYRPKGAMAWEKGLPPKRAEPVDEKKRVGESDTGTNHPHGTKYKPEMHRYHSVGMSRTTGIEYTTTVIEAIGVEHKETTRNYDILAAVFTDVLRNMHDDFGLV